MSKKNSLIAHEQQPTYNKQHADNNNELLLKMISEKDKEIGILNRKIGKLEAENEIIKKMNQDLESDVHGDAECAAAG